MRQGLQQTRTSIFLTRDVDHAYLPDNGKYHFSEPPRQQYVEERMPGGRLYDDGADWRVMG